MKPIIVLIMSSGIMLQACEQAPVRRTEMLAEHSGWGNEAAQLIKAGYLTQGMDQEQVEAAWGKPCWSCTGTTQGDWGAAWQYATQTVFFDKDGKVTRWEAN
ncbi:MAG: hypothetical protein ABL933_05005 [Methyloglobulus sp.]|nr:hypothetical protein [Methyloglobulus sp.]